MTCLPLLMLATAGLCAGALVHPPTNSDTFELLILHNNDMHARFEQTSQLSGACTTADREAGKCYGGFPRVAHVVKEARKAAQNGQGPPVLYLNAGDTYTGTAWFTIYKWKIAAEFINALQPDAVSLGNHEFDEAVDGLVPFIRNLSTPVLAANLILDKVPELQAEKNLLPSIVLIKNNVKIGIIGYLTAETKFLAPKNDVEYEDEVTALKREVKKLRQEGVTLFIALGHSGFVKDLEIAKYVDGIDLVIGGHSNTFLWNEKTTNEKPEIPQGPYPVEVRQSSGKIVRVVQAYAYTKYLGKLHLTINRFGNIIKCDGTPMLLDQSIPKDPEVLKLVEKYRNDIDKINNVVVGTSYSALHGEYCRLRECNIGVLITEAMVNYTRATYADPKDINIAIVQGGRIRTSIDHPEKPFDMTRGDWITVLPFTDRLVLVSMNGSILRQALEHAIGGWRIIDSPGQFLQFTGMNVTYDLARPPGSRIVSAKAVCLDCGGQLVDIQDNFQYKLLMSEFLADGGDGYALFEKLEKEFLSFNEVDCLIYYLARSGPINQGYTGRLTVLNEDKVADIQVDFIRNDPSSSKEKTTNSIQLLLYLVLIIFSLN